MKKKLFLALLPVTVAVCTNPTALCGCEPQRSHLVVHGTVRTAGGAPVPAAQVFALVAPPASPATDAIAGGGGPPAITASDGSYRIDVVSLFSPATTVSVFAAAVRPPADTLRSTTPGGSLRPQTDVPDSVRVDIVFP
jgi:hypothetical protein